MLSCVLVLSIITSGSRALPIVMPFNYTDGIAIDDAGSKIMGPTFKNSEETFLIDFQNRTDNKQNTKAPIPRKSGFENTVIAGAGPEDIR